MRNGHNAHRHAPENPTTPTTRTPSKMQCQSSITVRLSTVSPAHHATVTHPLRRWDVAQDRGRKMGSDPNRIRTGPACVRRYGHDRPYRVHLRYRPLYGGNPPPTTKISPGSPANGRYGCPDQAWFRRSEEATAGRVRTVPRTQAYGLTHTDSYTLHRFRSFIGPHEQRVDTRRLSGVWGLMLSSRERITKHGRRLRASDGCQCGPHFLDRVHGEAVLAARSGQHRPQGHGRLEHEDGLRPARLPPALARRASW